MLLHHPPPSSSTIIFQTSNLFSDHSSFMNQKQHALPQQPHHPRQTNHRPQLQLFWPRVVIRKWLNLSAKTSEYNADPEEDDSAFDSDGEEESCYWPKETQFKDKRGDDFQSHPNGAFHRLRRRKSETCRAQYIDAKELRVSVNTWNVGGKLPPEDLDIEDWLDVHNPADIYVIGFQEIIPLNAGNIFGAEDNRPVPLWEKVIRRTINKVQPERSKFKCYSNPSSPSRFKPSDDAPDIEDEVLLETDTEGEEEIYPFCDESKIPTEDCEDVRESTHANGRKLKRILSGTERIVLSWPEPPLDLLAHCVSERPNTLNTVKSFKASKSFRTYSSFKSYMNADNRVVPEDLESTMYRKRRSPYVRIVSKQMVGIFITIWVRRSLRKHIQNVHVSAVGVGVMGYIGNKGSISVSMSVYQTLFCFICTHLASGEKEADVVKRNTDVHEIHKRTRFNSISNSALPKRINNHERIIWLGDLNYRLNLSYEKTCDLISRNDWSKLLESDQLVRELRKGRAFDGWSEGVLDFPPTYKYELNSGNYSGEDPKIGRRTPAWCDRILSFGKGIRQMSYRRAEVKVSDHRPVSASYMIEVEVFSSRKLQKALIFTDAEINKDLIYATLVHFN